MPYTDLPEIPVFIQLEDALTRLTVYREVLSMSLIRSLRDFLGRLVMPAVPVEENLASYAELVVRIMEADPDGSLVRVLVQEIITTEQVLNRRIASHLAARHSMATSKLSEMAEQDLDTLQALAAVSPYTIKKLLKQKAWDQLHTELDHYISNLPVWHTDDAITELPGERPAYQAQVDRFVRSVRQAGAWPGMLAELLRFHQVYGVGLAVRYASLCYKTEGYEIMWSRSDDREPNLLDYHGVFAQLREESLAFANGSYAPDRILCSVAGMGKHSLIRDLERRLRDKPINLVYLETKETVALHRLFSSLDLLPQRSIIVVEAYNLASKNSEDEAFLEAMRSLMAKKSPKIIVYLLLDLSRSEAIHAKLMDRKRLLSAVHPSQEAFIQSFAAVSYLRHPEEAELTELLIYLATAYGLRLSDTRLDDLVEEIRASAVLPTASDAKHKIQAELTRG